MFSALPSYQQPVDASENPDLQAMATVSPSPPHLEGSFHLFEDTFKYQIKRITLADLPTSQELL